jgi:alpha-beta hydrolase superfamily lysophospholipase
MEENLKELINKVHPNESEKFEGIEDLCLTWKYLQASSPNPQLIRLFYRNLKHRSIKPSASLCMVHGFAEHSGKLLNVASYFALRGFEVHLIDLRSFGYSGGARCGHDLLQFQSDIKVLLDQARSDLPCFLYGHSMGGMLVTTILINNPQLSLSGALISAPLYESSSAEVGIVKENLFHSVAEVMSEGLFNSYIAPGCLSRDDQFLKGVFDDRKLMPFFGPKLGVSLLDHMKWVLKAAGKLKHPVGFFHGNDDTLTFAKTTKFVHDQACSNDKTFHVIPDAGHEPHHDICRDSFIPKLFQWAQVRAKALPFGKVYNFKVGLAGMPSTSKWPRLVLYFFIVVYLVIAFKVKIQLNPVKCLKIMKIFSMIFWPMKIVTG